MGTFMQDIRYGFRMLAKSPGHTAVAVFALALGIGANSSIFSMVDAILVHPLPFDQLDRLVMVFQANPRRGLDEDSVSPGNFVDIRDQVESFEQASAYQWWDVNVAEKAGGLESERVLGFLVSPEFFAALRVPAALGRPFAGGEDQPGHDQVVVLSDALWKRRFGSDPGVIGRSLKLNGETHTVIGVMPAGFSFPLGGPGLWAPLTLEAGKAHSRGALQLKVIARLRPGVTRPQAQAELSALAVRLQQQFPDTNAGWDLAIIPLIDDVVRYSRPIGLAMLAAVGFVLLIACANVANLLLAKASVRGREIAIRAALGAGRRRLIQQLLTESVLLALAGGTAGLVLAMWGVELIGSALPADIINFVPGWSEIRINLPVLLFTLGLSVITGLLFGLAPALNASRADLNQSLKEAGSAAGVVRHRVRGALVVGEIALALVLLVGAMLSINGFRVLMNENPGFVADHVLTMQTTLSSVEYPDRAKAAAFYQHILERVHNVPGVESAGLVSDLPLSGGWEDSTLTIEGRPEPKPGEEPAADRSSVSAFYFRAIGIPIVSGRSFTDQDAAASPFVAIVSEKMARLFWPGEDPIGKRFRLGGPGTTGPWRTIVGVAGDVRRFGLEADAKPTMYLPHLQSPRLTMTLVARASSEPSVLAAVIGGAVRAEDPAVPVYNVRTMDQVVASAHAGPRFTMVLMGILGSLALVLAAVGIYGVMAHMSAQRTHEIGIRMALGARDFDVLRMMLAHGMRLTSMGLVLGLAGSLGVTRLLAAVMFWMRPSDPAAFGGTIALLAAVAVLACYIPARRAARMDPLVALRHE